MAELNMADMVEPFPVKVDEPFKLKIIRAEVLRLCVTTELNGKLVSIVGEKEIFRPYDVTEMDHLLVRAGHPFQWFA
jgi:hypothetical protein